MLRGVFSVLGVFMAIVGLGGLGDDLTTWALWLQGIGDDAKWVALIVAGVILVVGVNAGPAISQAITSKAAVSPQANNAESSRRETYIQLLERHIESAKQIDPYLERSVPDAAHAARLWFIGVFTSIEPYQANLAADFKQISATLGARGSRRDIKVAVDDAMRTLEHVRAAWKNLPPPTPSTPDSPPSSATP